MLSKICSYICVAAWLVLGGTYLVQGKEGVSTDMFFWAGLATFIAGFVQKKSS